MTDSSDQEGVAASAVTEKWTRVLVISRRGPPERPFAWEIRDSNGELARSLDTFQGRDEAVADGQRKLDELQAGSVNLRRRSTCGNISMSVARPRKQDVGDAPWAKWNFGGNRAGGSQMTWSPTYSRATPPPKSTLGQGVRRSRYASCLLSGSSSR